VTGAPYLDAGQRATAQHEAAHAVAAILAGLVVHRVTIHPTTTRRGIDGVTTTGYPDRVWPVRTSRHADRVVSAAGYAWEALILRSPVKGLRNSWGDRAAVTGWQWWTGVVVAAWWLRRPAVRRAVREVAATAHSARRGHVGGRAVERIAEELGLFPGHSIPDSCPGVLWPRITVRPRRLRPTAHAPRCSR